MKKWVWVVIVLILGSIATIYVLIPTDQNIKSGTIVKSVSTGVARVMLNGNMVESWWPGKKISGDYYEFKTFQYRINKIYKNGISVSIFNNGDSINGMMQIAPIGNNETEISWTSPVRLSKNPYKRLAQYNWYKKIKSNIDALLQHTGQYLGERKNIYSLQIDKILAPASTMISYKKVFDHYPGTEEIYKMVDAIKMYILAQHGKEVNSPMLNVYTQQPGKFEAMVAIPTATEMPGTITFNLKKSPLGYFLVADVMGGYNSISKGEMELRNFITDNQIVSPAIPFQVLLTNRLQNTDSSNWITKLYYPVYN